MDITFNFNGNNELYQFTITTPRGVVYTFDEVERTVFSTANDIGDNTGVIADITYNSSWFLSEILAPESSERIEITYLSNSDNNPSNSYKQPLNYWQDNSKTYNTYLPYQSDPCSPQAPQGSAPSLSFGLNPQTTIFNRKFVETITLYNGLFEVERLIFNSSFIDDFMPETAKSSGRKLDQIQTQRKWKLDWTDATYFDFNYDAGGSDGIYLTGRLTLLSVQEKGLDDESNDCQKPPYVFDYDSGKLTDNIESSQDHWGFVRLGNGTKAYGKISEGSYNCPDTHHDVINV